MKPGIVNSTKYSAKLSCQLMFVLPHEPSNFWPVSNHSYNLQALPIKRFYIDIFLRTISIFIPDHEKRRPEYEICRSDNHIHFDPGDAVCLEMFDVSLNFHTLRGCYRQYILAALCRKYKFQNFCNCCCFDEGFILPVFPCLELQKTTDEL